MAEARPQSSPPCTIGAAKHLSGTSNGIDGIDSPVLITPEPSAPHGRKSFSLEHPSESEPSSRSNSLESVAESALGSHNDVSDEADASGDSNLLGGADDASCPIQGPTPEGSSPSNKQHGSTCSHLGHKEAFIAQPAEQQPLCLRTPFNLLNPPDLSVPSTSAVPSSLPTCFASANLDSDTASGEVIFPAFNTPSRQTYPAYVNPLYDTLEFPSPMTQPPSAVARDSTSVSGTSVAASPTRHIGSVPLARRLHRRRCHHHLGESRRLHQHQTATSDAAKAAAVLAASLPLLYDLAPRTQPASAGAKAKDPVKSLAALLGVGDSGSGRHGALRTMHSDRGHRGQSSARSDGIAALTYGVLEDVDEEEGPKADGFEEDEQMGTTLDLMRKAAALQRQLASRSQEVAMLQIQLEEATAAREEMGLELLQMQEYVVKLEGKLEQETRTRVALITQSQLLQEQLQETGEAWREAQAALQALQRQQQRMTQQQHHSFDNQDTIDQVPGSLSRDMASGPAGRPPRCPSSSSMAPAPPPLQSVGSAPEPGTSYFSAMAHGYGSTTPSMGPSWTVHPSFSGEDGDATDPRDFELAALRRENQALTKKLIQTSLELAQAKEEVEEARHEVHLLHDLNQGAMESVNTLSLELSLLRPNACGRARGRFSMPSFLRSSGGGGGSNSNAASMNGSFSLSAGGAMF